MDINEASSLARQLMDKHGLEHVPFEFDRSKMRLGAMHFNRYTNQVSKITLSRHFVALLPEDEVQNTILHEIAHALAGGKEGHGPVWRATARKIGARPERCATPSASPKGAIQGICPSGQHTYEAHRMPLRVKSCPKCHSGFSQDHILTWHKNGKAIPLHSMPVRYRDEAMLMNTKRMLGGKTSIFK